MLTSVLVANHNYAQYLPDALDGALGQAGCDIEVIVADDGSTDDSRDVLSGYGDRVVTLLQERGGQSSALNAAFLRSSGDLICLLDADDVFLPGKVRAVLAALERRPQATLVHHRLQIIDADGTKRHAPFPRSVWDGDLQRRVRRSGGWFEHAPTSALAFPRAYADRMFPIPTGPRHATVDGRRIEVELKPDAWLTGPAPFVGPVAGVPEPLALYRMHGRNKSQRAGGRVERIRRWMAQAVVEQQATREALHDRFGMTVDLQIDDLLPYHQLRWALGQASRAEAAVRTLRSPGLRPRARLRDSARIVVGRSWVTSHD